MMTKSLLNGAVADGGEVVKTGFFSYVDSELCRKRKIGKFSSADNLSFALKCLKDFWDEETLLLSDINSLLVSDFRDWLRSEGKKESTVHLYLNQLKGVYNRAVKEGLVEDARPFSDVQTGNVYYRQPVLSEREVSLIMKAEVKPGSWAETAKAFVCLMYMLCGIPPVDLIFLTWKQVDLKRMTLTYGRKKTGVGTTVRLLRKAIAILKMFKDKGKLGYVFPFITTTDPGKARRQCKNAERQLNRALQNLSKKIGLGCCGVSLYSFRRTWASVAHNDYDGQIAVISTALCHTNERTTAIYISRSDSSRLFILQETVWKGMMKHLKTNSKSPARRRIKNVSLCSIGRQN